VLQTLALIQRQSDSPREVARLARGQERELRNWLYGMGGYRRAGATDRPAADAGLTAALSAAAGEVEDTYAVTVRPVVVGGDRALDGDLRALVLAAREAMVNAAKHAGVEEVSVYAEVEPDEVNVFVRDRGAGFDPDAVPDDRHGLADSVRGRMARHGGTVGLRTRPGAGTEVHLRLPIDAASGPSHAAADIGVAVASEPKEQAG
jgi:signal transduction histidine kinase